MMERKQRTSVSSTEYRRTAFSFFLYGMFRYTSDSQHTISPSLRKEDVVWSRENTTAMN